MKEFWDQRYAADTFAYGTEPNAFLRSRALACPSADAVWRLATARAAMASGWPSRVSTY
jgi:hypothetical protein